MQKDKPIDEKLMKAIGTFLELRDTGILEQRFGLSFSDDEEETTKSKNRTKKK